VIAKYKEWLTTSKEGMEILADAKRELVGKVLACHCSPLPCHGHVLADLVNNTGDNLTMQPIGPDMSKFKVLQDGVVLICNILTLEEQQLMCNEIAKYGRGEVEGVGSFFSKGAITMKDGYVDPEISDSDPNSGFLNIGGTKARMNIPFEKASQPIWLLCKPLLEAASALCPSIPPLDHPTIWRINYYTQKGRIGWHFDRHPYVPLDMQHIVKEPVISVTIGNSGIFEYKNSNDDEAKSLTLRSGDVIIFGGPSRMILHQMPKILIDTKPKNLDMGMWPPIRNQPNFNRSFNPGRYNFAFYENTNLMENKEEISANQNDKV